MTADEIICERNRLISLAAKHRRADGSLPADIRDSLVWTNSLMRRLAMEQR